MRFFTLILDYAGGTYVSQYEARDPAEAMRAWQSANLIDPNFGQIVGSMDAQPVKLEGLSRAWCTSGEQFANLTIVETTKGD